MTAQRSARVVIFAGPNGSGKTTHADPILATLGISTFVNADYIARGLSGPRAGSAAFEAGRIMLKRIEYLANNQQDFAFESTLSSRSFAPMLRRFKEHGYRVAIYYFSLSSARLAQLRVRLRVKLGGHDVPADDIRRRFDRSIVNLFDLYLPLADEWRVFDNSRRGLAHLVASHDGRGLTVKEADRWEKLQSKSKRR
jgi:predicted ABC-type ATPase